MSRLSLVKRLDSGEEKNILRSLQHGDVNRLVASHRIAAETINSPCGDTRGETREKMQRVLFFFSNVKCISIRTGMMQPVNRDVAQKFVLQAVNTGTPKPINKTMLIGLIVDSARASALPTQHCSPDLHYVLQWLHWVLFTISY